MDLQAVTTEAREFLREFTGRVPSTVPTRVAGALLGLAGGRPRWGPFPLFGIKHKNPRRQCGVSLQVHRPSYLEAQGDLVSCAILLAVERYDASPRGRCPERLRALASVVAAEGHAVMIPVPPVR